MVGDLPLVSIVVLNYNGARYVESFLKSLLNKTLYDRYEVVFVDNCSSDDSACQAEMLSSIFKNFKMVRLRKNYGYAGGNLVGARLAVGDILVFCNVDIEVTSGWLTRLVRTLLSDRSIGLAQPKVVFMDDKTRINSVGVTVSRLCFPYNIGYGEIDLGQYDSLNEVPAVYGACFAVKREVISKVGLFDPWFFLIHEELDFSIRIRLAEYRICYVPSSVIFHAMGGSFKEMEETTRDYVKKYYSTRNRLAVIFKNFEMHNVLLLLAASFLLELLRTLYPSRSPRIPELGATGSDIAALARPMAGFRPFSPSLAILPNIILFLICR